MKEHEIKDWHTLHCEQAKRIENIAFSLLRLSRAFYKTGNETMGEELQYYSETLSTAQQDMRDAVSKSIDIAYKTSQDMSATILNATLAGISIAEKK